MNEPGRLLAKGRDTDVYDLGNGRVLRRFRGGPRPGQAELEARLMNHLRAHGAPVPEAFDVDGNDLVMERIAGRSLVDQLAHRPWAGYSAGQLLGRLHGTLASIEVPDSLGLSRVGEGTTVLHRDFHPGNVMVDGDDAMIIDWTNAAIGPPALDHAISWALLATGDPDDVPRLVRPLVNSVRRTMLTAYLSVVGKVPARAWVRTACDYRMADPNSREVERVRLEAFAAQVG